MINMVKEYSGNRGFTTTVAHNDTVDYLELAYFQALTIKTTQKNENNYAIIADQETIDRIEDKHRKVFDVVVKLPGKWNFAREWEVRNLSPWKRTVKLDSDLFFINDISNWWDSFEKWKILLTTEVENYRGEKITSRWHRELFDNNHMPDIYTAFYYFRDGVESAEFFELCEEISNNWDWFASEFLVKNDNPIPRDDEIFSIAAAIYGVEKCTLPNGRFPRFVHFREALNDLPISTPWHKQLYIEQYNQTWIGHYPQRLPIHYIDKSFVTTELIERYERNYRELF